MALAIGMLLDNSGGGHGKNIYRLASQKVDTDTAVITGKQQKFWRSIFAATLTQ